MSASTGTIRRPMARGSISAAAIGAVMLVAALGIAWGAINLTASRHAAAPAAAPAAQSASRYVGGQNFEGSALAVGSAGGQTYDFRGNQPAITVPGMQSAPFVAPTYDFRGDQAPMSAQGYPSSAAQTGAKVFVGDSLVSKPDITTPRVTHTTHPRHLAPR